MSNCPTCQSPAPSRHPAMQLGGEVQICRNVFHHGESCNLVRHEHGNDCSTDCPTCHSLRPSQLANDKLAKAITYLKELENAPDIPMHHQADICQFRAEILDDWSE